MAIFNIERCSWCQIVGFNSNFNILKPPLFLPLKKGHFQDGVQDSCRELKLLISMTIFNIERCSWCQIVGFNSNFNILKPPLFLPLEKGHFQEGVQDGCRELKVLISMAIFNIERCSWCQIVGFNSNFNILKASFILTTRKGSFSRRRSRWLPRAKSVDIHGNIQHRKVFWVSNRRL